MKDKRSTKSYNSHKRATKLTLLSSAWRCSSKLQVIQSWEILFQRPSKVHKYQYTHLLFLYFSDLFILIKKLKTKQKQTNKQRIKTKLTQTTTWTMQEIRQEKKSLRIFFLPDGRPGWRSFLWHELLFRWIRRRVETTKVREKHDCLKKFSKRD